MKPISNPSLLTVARKLQFFIVLILASFAVKAQAQVQVSVMPSYSQSVSYGNVALNEAITVWGRTWAGTGTHTYVLDFGDGTATQTGTVTDVKFIGGSHTYTSAGFKTITLTVTDGNAQVATRTSLLKVIASPTHEERVNMAIEKALLYLYRNQTISGETAYWGSTDEYGTGANGSTVLAFEENGHLPGNNRVEDVYSETAQRGLNYLVAQASTLSISNQAAGNPDTNGNGVGVWIGHQLYAHCFSLNAIIMGYPNAAAAQAALVPAGMGNLAGQSFYRVAVDMLDTVYYCQNDAPYKGWWYYVNTANNGSSNDGSIDQWPNMAFTLAKERWGLTTPSWVVSNSVAAFQALQNANGGVGYSDNAGWLNPAKTGGALTGYAFGGKTVGDNDVNRALSYIGQFWMHDNTDSRNNAEGWASQWYGMYGIKKGLTIQGISTVSTPYGARDWYRDMSAWLLGNATLLDTADPVNNPSNVRISPTRRSTANMFGQLSDGRWDCNTWPATGTVGAPRMALDTAHGVLILTKSVAVPVPVAVIAAISDQNLAHPSFQVNGSGSYHLDPNKSVSQYLWDWDASNGVDWNNPDASGPTPTNPGYTTVGTKTITLRVADSSGLTGTTTASVVVVDTDVRPIAVSIPANRLPAYAGHVGEAIQLDGTASYDPDGDAIVSYSWDTDGNGTYGDATGPNPTVTFNVPYTGQIGLRVTANGKTSTNAAVADIYAAPNDFYIQSISASNIVLGQSADVQVVVKNAAGSTGTWNGVTVRFYNANPLAGGVQIGGNYTVNLPPEGTATLNASLTGLNGLQTAFAYVDATKVVPEWDELNNTASVGVAVVPNVAPSFAIGTAGGNAATNGLTVGGSTYYSAGGSSVAVAPDLTYTNSVSPTTAGAQVSIDNGQAGDVLGWDTAITTANGISGSYNSTTKVLAFSGSATAAVYQSLLRSVTYSNASGTPTTTRTISFNVGQNTLYNPTNGHFYEYVAAGTSWVNAKNAAAAKTFNGLQGYLATVTSQAENDFIQTKLQADAWIGASDDSSYGASEGNWFWVTGPEAGTQFSTGSSSFAGRFQRWGAGEPNNSGGENYAEFYTTSFWNDLNGTQNLAYVVEYGGMAGDPATLSLTGSRSLIYKPTLPEDSGAYADGANFITNISPGPANESAQTVSFTVTNNNNSLFSVQPAIDASGTLTFTPAANAYGSATVTVIAVDSGDTANGGSNTSAPKTFTLTVTPVNDAPVLNLPASPLIVNATSLLGTPVTFTVTANDIEDGPLTPTASPLSGSSFPLGNTTVNVSVTDSNGATTTGSFVVRVVAPDIAVEDPSSGNILDGGTVNLGSVNNHSTTPFTFTVRNVGTGDLTGLSITKGGTNASEYSLSAVGSVTVAGSAFTTFTVTFAPTYIGPRTADIHIASNDLDENPFDINITSVSLPVFSPVVSKSSTPSGIESGTTYHTFYDAYLNSSRRVIYSAQLGTIGTVPVEIDQGTWTEGADGTLDLLMRAGTDLGNGQTVSRDFKFNRIADSGTSLLQNTILGEGPVNVVQWIDDGFENITLFASRTTDYSSYGAFQGFTYTSQNQTTGEGYFPSSLVQGGAGANAVTNANDSGVWRVDLEGSVTSVAREGDPMPVSVGVGLLQGTVKRAVVSTSDKGIYSTQVTGAGVTSLNAEVVLTRDFITGAPGTMLARTDSQAAGLSNGCKYFSFVGETVNAAGKGLFWAQLTGSGVVAANNRALFSDRNGSVAPVIRYDDSLSTAYGAGVKLSAISAFWLLDDNSVVIVGALKGTGVTASNDGFAAVIATNGTVTNIAREAQTLSVADNAKIGVLQRIDVSPGGKVSLLCSLVTGTGSPVANTSNNQVLLTTSVATPGTQFQLIRKGAIVGAKTLANITLSVQNVAGNTGATAGMSRLINDNGDACAILTFTDADEGVFVGP